jgi:hypothetical protein
MALSTDYLRILIGDTGDTPILEDEQIETISALYSDSQALLAAAALADAIAAKYSNMVAISISGLGSFQYGDRARAFMALATRLRAQANAAGSTDLGTPYVGGISKTDVATNDDNADRTPNSFKVGRDDYPGVNDPNDDQEIVP